MSDDISHDQWENKLQKRIYDLSEKIKKAEDKLYREHLGNDAVKYIAAKKELEELEMSLASASNALSYGAPPDRYGR